MKVSRDWLQTYFRDSLPAAQELADALTFHAFEIESVEAHGDDFVLDVKVTPNRGHDCLSHRGIAKELSAILMRPLVADPLRQTISLDPKTDAVQIAIQEPALCPRFTACLIRNVKVGPSPDWLRARLETIGQRSINNIVDITNLVMFDIGQPLHAFDAGKLTESGGTRALTIRKASAGESMTGLDDRQYELSNSMLVIEDTHAKTPVSIAGIKGGKPTGIDESTADVLIEGANWDGVTIRKSSQALKLRTDASARFEQVISPELTAYGVAAAAKLAAEIAGGEVAGYVDEYPVVSEKKQATVTTAFVNAALGTELQDSDIEAVLTRLDLAHTHIRPAGLSTSSLDARSQSGGTFEVQVPFERLDISIPEDLVEEVARIAGYDKIPAVELPKVAESAHINPNFHGTDRIREFLLTRGFSEVFTSVFAESGERAVLNKVDSVRPYLRNELMSGLREALDKNIRNKDLLGLKQVKLFEIGTRWTKDTEETMLCIGVERVKKEKSTSDYMGELALELGVSLDERGSATDVEEIPLDSLLRSLPAPTAYDSNPTSEAVRYTPFSRYPFIVRDIALWTPAGTPAEDVEAVIRSHAGEMLARLEQFDRFEKDGRVSYAFRLVFQSFDKTLTDGEANERMESVYAGVQKNNWEVR